MMSYILKMTQDSTHQNESFLIRFVTNPDSFALTDHKFCFGRDSILSIPFCKAETLKSDPFLECICHKFFRCHPRHKKSSDHTGTEQILEYWRWPGVYTGTAQIWSGSWSTIIIIFKTQAIGLLTRENPAATTAH